MKEHSWKESFCIATFLLTMFFLGFWLGSITQPPVRDPYQAYYNGWQDALKQLNK